MYLELCFCAAQQHTDRCLHPEAVETKHWSKVTALLCLPFQMTANNPCHVRCLHSWIDERPQFHPCLLSHEIKPNLEHYNTFSILNSSICLLLSSAHTGDFILAPQDGWATMSVVATEAAGVTVTTDLPVKCSWALRDPGSHGSQQHHPWDAGPVSDVMTWNQQTCSPQPKGKPS